LANHFVPGFAIMKGGVVIRKQLVERHSDLWIDAVGRGGEAIKNGCGLKISRVVRAFDSLLLLENPSFKKS
jgi:hypothetical protein